MQIRSHTKNMIVDIPKYEDKLLDVLEAYESLNCL